MDPEKSNQYRAGQTVIETDQQARELLDFLMEHHGIVGLDTETEGVDPRKQSPVNNGRVVCWSLAYLTEKRHDVWGTKLAHRVFLWEKHLELLRPYLENHKKDKVGHNIFTFDRHVLRSSSIRLQGVVGDTLRMSKLLRSDKRVDHSLKGLMRLYFGYELGGYRQLFYRPGQLASKFTTSTYKTSRQQSLWTPETFEECPGKWTRRKVQGKFVPTFIADGEHCRWSVSENRREPIPLSRIKDDYPHLLETLYDYATLDAKATVELYYKFKNKLEGVPWVK